MTLNTVDRWVVASVILSFVGVGSAAFVHNPLPIGISALIIIALLILACVQTRSPRLGWLLIFGLIAGVGELWADWIHVEYFRSLVYINYFGFRIVASPSYMPIGWWITVVQFGYLALKTHRSIPSLDCNRNPNFFWNVTSAMV